MLRVTSYKLLFQHRPPLVPPRGEKAEDTELHRDICLSRHCERSEAIQSNGLRVTSYELQERVWRHCERSEAIQTSNNYWIASVASQARNDERPRNDGKPTTHHPHPTSHIPHLTTHYSLPSALTLFLFFICATLTAQEVKLNYNDQKNKQTIRAQLYDSYNGDFLMDLPLTFHISQDYTLFMIIGDDTGIKGNTIICLFDKTMELKALEKDKNLKLSGKFKKQYRKVYPFFEPTAEVELLMPLQNHCEYVQNIPKPLFFQIKNYSKPVKLNLTFYIANPSGDGQYEKTLTAESGTVKITINIIK